MTLSIFLLKHFEDLIIDISHFPITFHLYEGSSSEYLTPNSFRYVWKLFYSPSNQWRKPCHLFCSHSKLLATLNNLIKWLHQPQTYRIWSFVHFTICYTSPQQVDYSRWGYFRNILLSQTSHSFWHFYKPKLSSPS